MTNKEVGSQLFIAEKTVKSHITNINKKLNVKSKIEAIEKARNLNLA
jgi:ATP/maltotriose-dependent transcriptional regulator MalT